MRVIEIRVDEERCVKCGNCCKVCEGGVWVWDTINAKPSPIHPERCMLCHECYFNCMGDAIEFVFDNNQQEVR